MLCVYVYIPSFLTSKTIPSLLGFLVVFFFLIKFCWQISPKLSELTTDNRIILKILFVKLNISKILNKENQPFEHACLMPLGLEQVLWP